MVDLQQALMTAAQLHQSGQLPQAEALYRQILQQHPNHPKVLHLMGILAHQVGKDDIAVELLRHSIRADGSQVQAYVDLGTLQRNRLQFNEAIECFRQILRFMPDSVIGLVELAMTLRAQGVAPADEMATLLRRAIALDPACAEAHNNLGNILLDQDKLADAIESFEKAIAANPKLPNAHNNLANALKDRGDAQAATASYRRAIELAPEQAIYHSNLIYAMHFDPDSDQNTIAAEEQKFSEKYERAAASTWQAHANDRDPERRLRIGYVSPHFYGHAESFFVAPLLEGHDRERFEVHCYSSVAKRDVITDRLQSAAEAWHEVRVFSDSQLAEKIRQDRIDILVDLTMHMGNNRLLMFSQKPAPLQLAWLAYPGSAGLKAIDYRLSDVFLDPIESDSSIFPDQPIRLPDCWVCYDPLENLYGAPELLDERSGPITFGSLNNPAKHNRRVLELWAKIMQAIPDSRLLILSKDNDEHHAQMIRDFTSAGVIDAVQRIDFVGPCPRRAYLDLFGRIDIALDPFPYNGITTTCDALWMGVPVLTQSRSMPASRAGLGLLTQVGLEEEWVAKNDEEFVTLAVKHAGDRAKLNDLRRELRQRMKDSPLMDARRFARNVENAYRQIWREWCAKGPR